MRTLTYGLKVPKDGDTGATIFPAMEYDIEQLDSHNHDGVNSPRISPASTIIAYQEVVFVAPETTVNMALASGVSTLQFDNVQIELRLISTGEVISADIVKASATSFKIVGNSALTAPAAPTPNIRVLYK